MDPIPAFEGGLSDRKTKPTPDPPGGCMKTLSRYPHTGVTVQQQAGHGVEAMRIQAKNTRSAEDRSNRRPRETWVSPQVFSATSAI